MPYGVIRRGEGYFPSVILLLWCMCKFMHNVCVCLYLCLFVCVRACGRACVLGWVHDIDTAVTPCLAGSLCTGCSSTQQISGTPVCCSDCASSPTGLSVQQCVCNITAGEPLVSILQTQGKEEGDMVHQGCVSAGHTPPDNITQYFATQNPDTFLY